MPDLPPPVPETANQQDEEIAVGQIWSAPDGRQLRIAGLSESEARIAMRNVETNRLTYMDRRNFDASQKWHLTRVLVHETAPAQQDVRFTLLIQDMRSVTGTIPASAAWKWAVHLQQLLNSPTAALASRTDAPSTQARETTAWLVALGSSTPQWWTGRGDEWTADVDGTQRNPACTAMRFARREDAERAIGWLIKEGTRDGCKAEEHIWLS